MYQKYLYKKNIIFLKYLLRIEKTSNLFNKLKSNDKFNYFFLQKTINYILYFIFFKFECIEIIYLKS